MTRDENLRRAVVVATSLVTAYGEKYPGYLSSISDPVAQQDVEYDEAVFTISFPAKVGGVARTYLVTVTAPYIEEDEQEEDGYDQLADTDDLVVAREELDALYEWLSQSPAGEDHDLHGLDVAITVLGKLIEKNVKQQTD